MGAVRDVGSSRENHATLATAIAASSPWRSTSLKGILGSGGRWHHSDMTASAVRRVALRKADRVALVILILAGLTAFYATAIEPHWLEVSRHELPAAVRTRLTVAQVSDLHTGGVGRRERAVLEALERERPDLIVITGDSVVDGDLFAPKLGLPDDPSYGKVADVLRRMRAPLGVWAVRGNWENVRHTRDERAFYAAAGVRLLVNESAQVRDDFWLVGLDDADSGGPDVARAQKSLPAEVASLTLMHSPAFFTRLPESLPLALAGHTHGGQVRLPGVAPWLPSGSGEFVSGWYSKGKARLFVSRGIGTAMLPIRFGCRPELAIFSLVPGPH